jgi:hypothetical protein
MAVAVPPEQSALPCSAAASYTCVCARRFAGSVGTCGAPGRVLPLLVLALALALADAYLLTFLWHKTFASEPLGLHNSV